MSRYCSETDHHPEWANVFSKVDVVLTTHDVEGVSVKDIGLAVVMDKIKEELEEAEAKKDNDIKKENAST